MATTVIQDFTVEPRTDDPTPRERPVEKPAPVIEREIEAVLRRELERALRLWAY